MASANALPRIRKHGNEGGGDRDPMNQDTSGRYGGSSSRDHHVSSARIAILVALTITFTFAFTFASFFLSLLNLFHFG